MTARHAALAASLALLFLCSAPTWAGQEGGAATQAALPGMSLYNLTSPWTTQEGRETRLASLRGRPAVVAMIYTSCPDICPLIAESMEQIRADLPDNLRDQVAFALFSFDSARDVPRNLKAFAADHHLDLRHWTLFHGGDGAVRDLASALDVSYRRNDDGNFDHAVVISLLDADGVVAYRQAGFRPDTKEFISHIEGLYRRP